MAQGIKTGGRQKGTPNKKTVQVSADILRKGISPLEYMLRVMRDEAAPVERRDEMAKAAAPYIHSKMPTAIVTPPPPEGDISDEDETLLNYYLHGLHPEAHNHPVGPQ